MTIAKLARIWLTRSKQPFIFHNEFDQHLDYQELENLGLYVHIPFCKSICTFCPYCKVLYDNVKALQYKEALIKEIHMIGETLKEKKEVTSLYFGGGSPALLKEGIGDIIQALHKYYVIKDGIGIELHPEDVTVDTLQLLKTTGITRISIGIQSFQEECSKLIGRNTINYNDMFQALKEVPFDTVSMDLIFAIPGQTSDSLKQDIITAFEHGANHIAIYPFIEFSFSNNKVRPMPEKEKRRLLNDITEYCTKLGYIRTSIWTYAKEKTNTYSSMTRDNFLGFGCSATTLLRDQFKINTFSIDEYINRIEAKQLPTSLTIRFSLRQRMVYYLFWSAYTTAVDPDAFEKFFGIPLNRMYGLELHLSRLLGFVKKDGKLYRMTPKGAYYYHYFEQFYTLAYIDKMWSIMRKEAFPSKIEL